MSIKHVAIRNSKVESTSMARSNRLRVEVPRTKKMDRCRGLFFGSKGWDLQKEKANWKATRMSQEFSKWLVNVL